MNLAEEKHRHPMRWQLQLAKDFHGTPDLFKRCPRTQIEWEQMQGTQIASASSINLIKQ
jgi:hypothetical protein